MNNDEFNRTMDGYLWILQRAREVLDGNGIKDIEGVSSVVPHDGKVVIKYLYRWDREVDGDSLEVTLDEFL